MGEGSAPREFKFASGGLEITVTPEINSDGPGCDSELSLEFAVVDAQGSQSGQYVLHWGVVADGSTSRHYQKPAKEFLPEGTSYRPGKMSVRSAFPDSQRITLRTPESTAPDGLLFLIYREEPDSNQTWFKWKGTNDFYLDLAQLRTPQETKRRAAVAEKEAAAIEAARKDAERRQAEEKREREEREAKERAEYESVRAEQEKKLAKEREELEARKAACDEYIEEKSSNLKVFDSKDYEFANGQIHFRCLRPKSETEEELTKPGKVLIVTNMTLGGNHLFLHWGLKLDRRGSGWSLPPTECQPDGSRSHDDQAVQTEFANVNDSVRAIEINQLPDGTYGLLAVLYAPPNQWYNKPGGGDMYIPVADTRPIPGLDASISKICKDMVTNIVEVEMEYGSWTLMHRYNHASHIINSIVGEDPDGWAAIYVWMRYSQLRVLDWQRNYNTQPRQLSSSQMDFVTLLARKYRELPQLRWLVRMVMSCVGRGGSGGLGQRIRDDILHILRHHRGWGHGSMMEEWHQKLHNNTNPDDVIICNALLAFWHSFGNIEEYRRVLRENDLTPQRLQSYDQKIFAEPDYVPHIRDTMLHELGRYGDLLTQVHLGTDLHTSADYVRGYLWEHIRGKVDGYLYSRDNSGIIDILGAASAARGSLREQIVHSNMNNEQVRDMLFLDIAIEADCRRIIEGGISHDESVWSHLKGCGDVAHSLMLSEGQLPSAERLANSSKELFKVAERISYYGESEDAGLRAAAAISAARNSLTEIVDRFKRHFGSLGESLGNCFNAGPSTVSIFVEEAVRGGPAFSLSVLLRKAEPAIRRIARLGPFSVIAPHYDEVVGEVYVFDHLRKSMALELRPNSIIVADKCDGDEDVPEGCAYIIIGSTVDILSHVAVRARNENHGLIACFDSDKMQELRDLENSVVKAKLEGEMFSYHLTETSSLTRSRSERTLAKLKAKSQGLVTPPSGLQSPRDELRSDKKLGKRPSENSLRNFGRKQSNLSELLAGISWAIRPSEFTPDLVGGKSANLAKLNQIGLPEWIKVPTSVTIPNGSLKKVMRSPENEAVAEQYRLLRGEIYAAEPTDVSLCPKIRECIMELALPEGLAAAIRGILDELGSDSIDDSLPGAWTAVKAVWASLWNERAHLARRKLKMDSKEVDMAVLCQKIVDADYAFVIHTTNPITTARDEIYGEIVVGLGETLVSNAPGQALGFVVKKSDIESPQTKSYPSKPFAMKGGEYIFRSDSNAEDLDNFAGAGLHDSIPIVESAKVEIDYTTEKLMLDDAFRTKIMTGVAKIGLEVEKMMGGMPQDIEGCYKDGEYYVVQARPQIV